MFPFDMGWICVFDCVKLRHGCYATLSHHVLLQRRCPVGNIRWLDEPGLEGVRESRIVLGLDALIVHLVCEHVIATCDAFRFALCSFDRSLRVTHLACAGLEGCFVVVGELPLFSYVLHAGDLSGDGQPTEAPVEDAPDNGQQHQSAHEPEEPPHDPAGIGIVGSVVSV